MIDWQARNCVGRGQRFGADRAVGVITAPGRAPVGFGSSHTIAPFTHTLRMPVERMNGSSNVLRSITVAGSKSTRSAQTPFLSVPRSVQLQPRRRERGHLANRFFQREPVALAHEAAEHARERAGAARMAHADAAIARHHRPRPLIERADVLVHHRRADDGRAAILHDTGEEFDRRDALALGDRRERLEFVVRMRGVPRDQHVLGAADVVQALARRRPDRRSACSESAR